MTVCIAAMCEGGIIFGAADRMKTAGDVQFEPPMPKKFHITNSIVVMTAGDALFHGEILGELCGVIYERVKAEPDNWWKVKDVAELYAYFHNATKQRRAENAILVPLGLNRENFISRQSEMSNEFIASITKELLNFNMPLASSIITGIDANGPHIYRLDNDKISCWDHIGFVSIGNGSRHAESQFMFARHAPNSLLSESLLLTYSAKKRSEVAPGVGCETDMFMIGPLLGSATDINAKTMAKLDEEYQKIILAEKDTQVSAKNGIKQYVDELKQASAQQEQKTSSQTEESIVKPVTT
jgi:hypothetical protein